MATDSDVACQWLNVVIVRISVSSQSEIYLVLGNIALVFAAQVYRDSEIARFPIRIYYGVATGLPMGSLWD